MFDPKAHLIQLPRRVKDPVTRHFVTCQDEYLEVKWRLVWFCENYPHGSIVTEEMCIDLDSGYARFRATVEDGDCGKATGTGTETRKSFEDFVEQAETRSIGRALAALGIGTQFVGEELSEGDHVADAPVTAHVTNSNVGALPAGESPMQAPPERRPTADEITTLVDTARAAHVDLEAFGHDMRRLMQLPETQKATKKFLREHMTMNQYDTARTHYGEALRVLLEEDVPNHEPSSAAVDAHASKVVPEAESPEPAHVPAGTTTDEAKAALRREAIELWSLSASEVDHILTHHHDLTKCRNLLWKARRPQSHQTLTAAD
jgi:hypothetical protein